MFNPINDKIKEAMNKLMPELVKFTSILDKNDMDRTRIDLGPSSWIFIDHENFDANDLMLELVAVMMAQREYTGEEKDMNIQQGFYDEPTKKKKLKVKSDMTSEFEKRLDDDNINHTDIKELAASYDKEKIERLANDMGYNCDWDNNYLTKQTNE
jgi:hypothetical protein